jgi:hypothetical protein
MTEPAAVTIAAPDDWVAAAAGHRRRFPDTPWGRHQRTQLGRTLAYLRERAEGGSAGTETVKRRAARILAADPPPLRPGGPGAPELERMLGIPLATALEGQDVKCRDCRRTWKCLPEDPYYEATTADDGLCAACMLAGTRRDVAVPAIEPTAVTAPAPADDSRPPTDTGELRAIDARAEKIMAGIRARAAAPPGSETGKAE